MVPKVHSEPLRTMGRDETGNMGRNQEEDMHVLYMELRTFPGCLWRTLWKVGHEDPRRIIHALKVGLALTLVSLLYLLEPSFKGVGENAIWAAITVVVVLEFTAGATLCKGLNRAFGTILASGLALLIECISDSSGRLIFKAIFIGAAVFLIGAATTYMRFIPRIKKNYDYGFVIFILTFSMLTVSSYRVDDLLKVAKMRCYMIGIGCGLCLLMSLLVFPICSGDDLHKSILSRFEGLAKSVEVCVNEYFKDEEDGDGDGDGDGDMEDDMIYKGYKVVLDSKSTDETMASYASWEPRHLKNWCHSPWQQYVKVGTVLRQFGCTVVALHGCLNSAIQAPRTVRTRLKDPCIRVAGALSELLIELASSIRNRRQYSPEILYDQLHEALQDISGSLNSQPRLFFGSNSNHDTNMLAVASSETNSSTSQEARSNWASMEQLKEYSDRETISRPQMHRRAKTTLEFSDALPVAAFAFQLVDTVVKLDQVIKEVEELGRIACFKEFVNDENRIVVCCI